MNGSTWVNRIKAKVMPDCKNTYNNNENEVQGLLCLFSKLRFVLHKSYLGRPNNQAGFGAANAHGVPNAIGDSVAK